MAALTDTYQPKGLPFSQHYPDTSPAFDDREEDEGDIVKSKPKVTSYLPLVNEAPHRVEEASERRREGGQGFQTRQRQEISDQRGREKISLSSERNSEVPPNGRIPAVESITPALQSDRKSSSGGGTSLGVGLGVGSGSGGKRPGKSESTPPSQASALEDASSGDKEGEGKAGLEDSTTALLRRYTMERNGRPTSIHLGPSGEIVGSGWLSEILVTSHKKCSVTLEEDYITWRYLSRKDCEFLLPSPPANPVP